MPGQVSASPAFHHARAGRWEASDALQLAIACEPPRRPTWPLVTFRQTLPPLELATSTHRSTVLPHRASVVIRDHAQQAGPAVRLTACVCEPLFLTVSSLAAPVIRVRRETVQHPHLCLCTPHRPSVDLWTLWVSRDARWNDGAQCTGVSSWSHGSKWYASLIVQTCIRRHGGQAVRARALRSLAVQPPGTPHRHNPQPCLQRLHLWAAGHSAV